MWKSFIVLILTLAILTPARAQNKGPSAGRVYANRLTRIDNPAPLLADYPQYVEPIRTGPRFEAPCLLEDADADLDVRGWRFSYHARGIVEVPNRVQAKATAIIVVHPLGVDDGQGFNSPAPAGAAFHCTPFKNALTLKHMKDVINPLLRAARPCVGLVGYSLPGPADPIRKKMYRTTGHQPSRAEREQGARELTARLAGFSSQAQPLPEKIVVAADRPVADYFREFPGLDPGEKYCNVGFWDRPIPVARPLEVGERDLVFFDNDGYAALRDYLKQQGIRHVLLAGYSTDMCVCSTTAGYANLCKDFNVFLIGDATLATFPAHDTPRFATSAAVSLASLDLFITQVSWLRFPPRRSPERPTERPGSK